MEGKLGEHPLAELIREITATALTGALRLAQDRAQVVIYFEGGQLVFAMSNLRSHRLREVVKRNGLTEAHVAEFPARTPDEDIAAAMIKTGLLKPDTLAAIRVNQVSDVLRLALLWTDGSWVFESRVRLADTTRVQIDVNRLLLECARHLPATFVASRLERAGSTNLKVVNNSATSLLPAEVSILERASNCTNLNDLKGPSIEDDANNLRAIYALSLAGLLELSDWPTALGDQKPVVAPKAPAGVQGKARNAAANEPDDLADLEALFARLTIAKDHYEVLDVGRVATIDEIKKAYHGLARRFHPDRFHQSEAQLRNRVESAFARIAHAYETLSDQPLRTDYDANRTSKLPAASVPKSAPSGDSNGAKHTGARVSTDTARAEASFQHGLDALKRNRPDEAVRFLAEAAMLSPREARYRAHYGYSLIRQSNTRRIAETELQTALTLEPGNAAYRVMLAELYKNLGLLKRAEGELERALALDSKNEAARALLLGLKGKSQKTGG
jgi:curved DNA-binding protein CbpA